MSSATTGVSLDLTTKGLFPKIEAASTDPKCVIISEVMQQMTKNWDMSSITQSTLQDHATKRYVDLSQESRLSLPDADHRAFRLYQEGVTSEIAQKYYSFRLSETDAKKWKIVIV